MRSFFPRQLFIFRKQMTHVFAKAENHSNDYHNGANSTHKEHPNQNVIQSFQ
jgi:hypothetical protein